MHSFTARIFLCLCLMSSPAIADCGKLENAMVAVEDMPGVRQKTYTGAAEAATLLAESLKLPDAMYLREGDAGKWRRVPFDSAQRKTKALHMLKLMPLSDCIGPRAATDGAIPMSVFAYAQDNPMKTGEKTHSSLWLDADGRIRRLVLEDGSYQTFEYGAFEAPATEPARRAKAR